MITAFKYLLGMVKRIVVMKNEKGDYCIYDSDKDILNAVHIYDIVDDGMFLIDQPLNEDVQSLRVTASDIEDAIKMNDFYKTDVFSINLISINKFPKDSEVYYIVMSYIKGQVKRKKGFYWLKANHQFSNNATKI